MTTIVEIIERRGPELRRLKAGHAAGLANNAIGRAVVKLIRGNFLALPPNQRGFPTTHFWRRAAAATGFAPTSDGVEVRINQTGVRQRLLGGEINSVRGKFLTIPAIAETYGRTARDCGALKIVRGHFMLCNGRVTTLALVPADLAVNKNQPVNPASVFFWLVAGVRQEPNPKVLPADEQIRAAAVQAARDYLAGRASNKNHN